MDRGAWQATVRRVAQSQTRLKWLSTHTHKGKSMPLNFPLSDALRAWLFLGGRGIIIVALHVGTGASSSLTGGVKEPSLSQVLDWDLGLPDLMPYAKSLQSCLILCDPIDSSPTGSPSLGFSRQEHWSGLPFPSPMHESEKWKWNRSVVSNTQQPHGLQPSRLLHPWDFPGKSTGVGCHCLGAWKLRL